MAFTNDPAFIDETRTLGPDATAGFEPVGRPSNPTEHASSESLYAAKATDTADDLEEEDEDDLEDDDLDEEDDLEDDDEDELLDDEDDDLDDDEDDEELEDDDEEEAEEDSATQV